MSISKLTISHLRNIDCIELQPAAHFNLITGKNGSGKTSFLEAIHFLSTGKSFRTHLNNRVIQHNQSSLAIHAVKWQDDLTTSLGIEKCTDGSRSIKISGQASSSLAEFVKHVPTQLITTTSYRYFHDGSKQRRQFFDWGLFHVKPQFIHHWTTYQKALKQRNAAIKSQSYTQEIQVWDEVLTEHGNQIQALREAYLEHFVQQVRTLFTRVLKTTGDLEIRYSKGWGDGKSLQEALRESLAHDMKRGYTNTGPHRADYPVYLNNIKAHEYLSQGQQKMALFALSMAQGCVLKQMTNVAPIYLIDDLPSELDNEKQQIVCEILQELKAQVFITCIESKKLEQYLPKQTSVFEIEQGKIKKKR